MTVRRRLALAERADPAEHVARDALGHRRVAHLDALGAERRADRLQRQLAATGTTATASSPSAVDEQGLEDLVGIEPERLGRLDAVGARRRVVLVLVDA